MNTSNEPKPRGSAWLLLAFGAALGWLATRLLGGSSRPTHSDHDAGLQRELTTNLREMEAMRAANDSLRRQNSDLVAKQQAEIAALQEQLEASRAAAIALLSEMSGEASPEGDFRNDGEGEEAEIEVEAETESVDDEPSLHHAEAEDKNPPLETAPARVHEEVEIVPGAEDDAGAPVAAAVLVSRNAELEQQLRQANADIERLMSELEAAQAQIEVEAAPEPVDAEALPSLAEAESVIAPSETVATRMPEEPEVVPETEVLDGTAVAAAALVSRNADLEAQVLQDAAEIERLKSELEAARARVEVVAGPDADSRDGAPVAAAALITRVANLEAQARQDSEEIERLKSELEAAQAQTAIQAESGVVDTDGSRSLEVADSEPATVETVVEQIPDDAAIVPEDEGLDGAPVAAAALIAQVADLETQVRQDAEEIERLKAELEAAQARIEVAATPDDDARNGAPVAAAALVARVADLEAQARQDADEIDRLKSELEAAQAGVEVPGMADVAERKGVPVAVAASVSRNADLEEQLRQATAEINRLMSELEIAQAKDGLEALPNAVDDWVPSSSAEADGEPEHVGAVAERSSEEVEIASEAEDLVRATVAAAEGVPSDAELEAKTLQDADDIERLRAEFLAALAQIEDESAPQAVDGEGSPSPAESERESAPAGSVEIVPEADDRSGAPFVAAGLVSRNADLEVQVREDAAEFERLESQLAAAQAEAAGLREERDASDIVRTGAAVAIGGALLSEEPEATTEASDEVHVPDQPDDFTVFEGIGPTRAARLHNAGILTYADLAACDEDHLREVLALQPWQRSDPALWIAEAKWLVVHPRKPLIGDNLRRIEGIGPTYLARLRAAGLITFADIANASPDYLSELISAPAWRKLTIEEWIAQAQLLVAGDEEGLRALQQDLNRRDTNKLILIEGLGPKGIAAMNAVGITGVTELAEAKPEQLAQAFSAAGLRPGHFEAWIAEAKLRAAGKRVVHTHGAHLGEGE